MPTVHSAKLGQHQQCRQETSDKSERDFTEAVVDHDMLTTSYLPHITYHLFCPAIRWIEFRYSDQVTDEVLLQLSYSLCKLQRVTLEGCSNITDLGLHTLLSKQDQLIHLRLKDLEKITAKSLQGVKTPQLKNVYITRCNLISNDGITTLVKNNPQISTLHINPSHKMTEEVLPVVAECLQDQLVDLNICGLYTVSDEVLLSLGKYCPNIKRLNVDGLVRITSDSLSQLYKVLESLNFLDLSFCYKTREPPGNRMLEEVPAKMSSLSLGGLQVEGDRLPQILGRLPMLTDLRLTGVNTITADVADKMLKEIGHNLINLNFGGCHLQFDDECLKPVVKYCHNLECLSLDLCTRVRGEPLKDLLEDDKRAKKMKVFSFSACKDFCYDILCLLALRCVNLEELYLSQVKCMGDDVLMTIANNLPLLKYLSLKSCTKGTDPVTDSGVIELARCCPLQELVVSGIHTLTDKSVFALANSCPDLECFYVSGCNKITTAAINYLQDMCNGRVHVVHNVPSADPNLLMAKNLDTGEFLRMDQERYQQLN
ncbi:putative F-box/LRR-repeat protein 2 [Apostichopus japonicus]|uniref:Putative F-box/LRR-repeat protein 2 n=1 Tax=Stichopus japonicus TaxID=307972 RepID=A0A2G8L159_STIJA|nr:putative F-box/LRR-repeat protein 2 [Apostichopus japonicus]